MVYNDRTYPLLTRLFAHLGVPTAPTSMSFSASVADGSLEYGGGSLRALLVQPANLLNPAFARMLLDIVRFNSTGLRYLEHAVDNELSLGEFLSRHGFGRGLGEWYLLPMAAAIWSAPVARMLDYPVRNFLSFFANHGLLSINGLHPWRTVVGGSASMSAAWSASSGRPSGSPPPICRRPWGVDLTDMASVSHRFDQVVLACHGDQVLRLVEDASPRERGLLGAFTYQSNRAVVHGGPSLMPRRRAVWSSWNYLAGSTERPGVRVSVTYWMNSLQSLPCREDLFMSLNPLRDPDPRLVHGEVDYAHPLFDAAALAAQAGMAGIQGRDGIWYAGARLGHGFHEDGLRAGLAVARSLGVAPPWEGPVSLVPSGAMGFPAGAAAHPA